jgi:hypothetical protein
MGLFKIWRKYSELAGGHMSPNASIVQTRFRSLPNMYFQLFLLIDPREIPQHGVVPYQRLSNMEFLFSCGGEQWWVMIITHLVYYTLTPSLEASRNHWIFTLWVAAFSTASSKMFTSHGTL